MVDRVVVVGGRGVVCEGELLARGCRGARSDAQPARAIIKSTFQPTRAVASGGVSASRLDQPLHMRIGERGVVEEVHQGHERVAARPRVAFHELQHKGARVGQRERPLNA